MHVYYDLFHSMSRRLLSSTLFPYTTLFRSTVSPPAPRVTRRLPDPGRRLQSRRGQHAQLFRREPGLVAAPIYPRQRLVVEPGGRSEEHTSELQSRFDLVCRLLLEKKNENTM